MHWILQANLIQMLPSERERVMDERWSHILWQHSHPKVECASLPLGSDWPVVALTHGGWWKWCRATFKLSLCESWQLQPWSLLGGESPRENSHWKDQVEKSWDYTEREASLPEVPPRFQAGEQSHFRLSRAIQPPTVYHPVTQVLLNSCARKS